MPLAIFDLDNTLLNGDSDFLWGEFMAEIGMVSVEEYRQHNARFFAQYQAGKLDIHEYLIFVLKPLAKYPLAELSKWRAQFIEEKIIPIIIPKAQETVRAHKARGDTTILMTATNRFIIEPILPYFDFDDSLATELEMNSNGYTGQLVGLPCFQGGKVAKLQEWLSATQRDLTGSYFYSDSQNDLPLLNLVENPIAVNADPTLRRHAKKHNWRIINWQ